MFHNVDISFQFLQFQAFCLIRLHDLRIPWFLGSMLCLFKHQKYSVRSLSSDFNLPVANTATVVVDKHSNWYCFVWLGAATVPFAVLDPT